MEIYKGIASNHSENNCFICKNDINRDDIIEALPCNCIIYFCSEECKSNYYKCLCDFFNQMEFSINIKCGRCNSMINRTKFLENLNFENDNMRKALKNTMIEFYKAYCMNCLGPVGDKAKTIRCKCPQLNKLLDTNKFEHKLCRHCQNASSGNCKICNLYHARLLN